MGRKSLKKIIITQDGLKNIKWIQKIKRCNQRYSRESKIN